MRRVSERRKEALKEYQATKTAYVASKAQGKPAKVQCERCSKLIPAKSITIHHKRGRIASLLCDTRHFSLLCLACHRWVGENMEAARKLGLLCERGLYNTPDRS